MMMVTAATPSSPKYFITIRLNSRVVMPVENSVNISLLPLVQDLSSTFASALGRAKRMLPNRRK